MKLGWSAALVALTLVFAGCVADNEPVDAHGETVEQTGYKDDRIQIDTINESNQEWEPTLDEQPRWVRGLWWNVLVTSAFDGSVTEAQRVVAGAEGSDHWLVGMPTHDYSNDLMVLHVPGFGQVKQDTLGFEAHDYVFDPLQFPLTEDTAWSTVFEAPTANEDCSVQKIEGLKAYVQCLGAFEMNIVYDAEMRAIAKMEIVGYATYEVTDWGFDWANTFPEWEKLVTVPHMADLIFFHGRLAGAGVIAPDVPIVPPSLGAPFDTVTIASTYDRVSFSFIMGDIVTRGAGGALPATGYYYIEATAPNGDVYSEELSPTEMEPLELVSHKHDKPGGDWEITYVAAGPGVSFIEGIGYHVYDVDISTGRILPSVGEHQHGAGDGH